MHYNWNIFSIKLIIMLFARYFCLFHILQSIKFLCEMLNAFLMIFIFVLMKLMDLIKEIWFTFLTALSRNKYVKLIKFYFIKKNISFVALWIVQSIHLHYLIISLTYKKLSNKQKLNWKKKFEFSSSW